MATHEDIGKVTWILDDEGIFDFLRFLRDAPEVVFDLETTGLSEHAWTGGPLNGGVAARVVLASFTIAVEGEAATWVLPLSHPASPFMRTWKYVLLQVAHFLLDHHIPVIGHNVKFDCRWVYACTGADISRLIEWDTQISSHLLDEVESTRLKERAPATFGVMRWDDHDLSTPGAAERVDLWDLGLYAARDTYWTWRLLEDHRARMNPDPSLGVDDLSSEEITEARLGLLATWCAMPAVASLTRIEQRGFMLDTAWTRERLREEETAAAGALEALGALAEEWGMQPPEGHGRKTWEPTTAATALWFKALTEEAVERGHLTVVARTGTGAPQWDKGVLARLALKGSTVAETILAHRKATKAAEYLRSWLDTVSREGAMHATYHAGRVITGRLSCSDSNMQQVTKALKPAFIPRPGHVIVDIDYSQIELRVAAFISRCQPMIEAFRRGDDLHKLLALRIIRDREQHVSRLERRSPRELTIEDVTPEERQKGKSANFGLLYMMGPSGFQAYAETAYGVALSFEEAEAIHSSFFSMWDGMSAWHARTVHRAKRTGQVVSPIGRVRRLPDISNSNGYLAGYAERAAVNAPVQGFASDLMQIAAASIQGLIPGYAAVPGAHLLATVHDDIVAEVPEDSWKEITEEMMDRMVNLNPILAKMDCTLDVPLAAEASVGTRWGLSDVGVLTFGN